MKFLITILCCIMISCTTTVIQPPERPNLVGTWACSTRVDVETTLDINEDGVTEVYRGTFNRYDTLIISADTIRHLQLIRAMDSVPISDNRTYPPPYIVKWTPKNTVLYHDTTAYSRYETSGDGYNIYLFDVKVIWDNEYNFIDSVRGVIPYNYFYLRDVTKNLNYHFYTQELFVNTKGRLEQFLYYQPNDTRLSGYAIPIIYTKIN